MVLVIVQRLMNTCSSTNLYSTWQKIQTAQGASEYRMDGSGLTEDIQRNNGWCWGGMPGRVCFHIIF